ncbi:MAG TPA: hypothetical protein PK018_02035 [Candidatus Competibacter sp.]|nr:hypothetical protein [Candidatus Competibacteraceae bacterium]HPE70938.1 hypothetical protein [Candidatus Competibacter sp.]HRW64466.1 hypothetical protein [Candidatus Competibacter sp.]
MKRPHTKHVGTPEQRTLLLFVGGIAVTLLALWLFGVPIRQVLLGTPVDAHAPTPSGGAVISLQRQ